MDKDCSIFIMEIVILVTTLMDFLTVMENILGVMVVTIKEILNKD